MARAKTAKKRVAAPARPAKKAALKAPAKRSPAARKTPPAEKAAPKKAGPEPARTELARMVELLDRAWNGPAWHGPAVLEALEGVTAAQAAARPIAHAHSIGELVLHMATWKRAVASRLRGVAYAPDAAENFPEFREADWERAREKLATEHRALRAAVAGLTSARLTRPAVKGGSYSYLQAHGMVHHDLWHAGQIMVLRRALED